MSHPDLPSVAIVGPGRAGQALAKRWFGAGVRVEGFLGRTIQAASDAVRFVGAGRVLDIGDLDAKFLQETDAVLIAVQDDKLGGAVGQLAAQLGKIERTRSILFFHCSGSHGLDILEPLRGLGAHTASFHPLCPLPTPEAGFENLAGKLVVLEVPEDDAASRTALETLARKADLDPIAASNFDRLLYHTACVLAANGLTSLYALVQDLFERAMPGGDVGALPGALMQGALDACREHGPVEALSGPVLRGDAQLIARQLEALRDLPEPTGPTELTGSTADVFQSLMRGAATMAEKRQTLRGEALQEMRKVLGV